MRSILLPTLLITLCATGVAAGAAQAATVTAEGGALVIRAGAGEKNFVSFGPSTEKPGLISVSDTADLQYDASICEPEFGEHSKFLACAPQPGGVVVEAGDGDDVINTGDLPTSQAVTVHAGAGNDVVRGPAFGQRSETNLRRRRRRQARGRPRRGR